MIHPSWEGIRGLLARARPEWVGAALVGILSVSLAVIVSPRIPFLGLDLDAGDVAPSDQRAPKDFLVEDTVATAARRREAEEAVLPVYDADATWLGQAEGRLAKAFAAARKGPPGGRREEFESLLGADLPGGDLEVFDRLAWSSDLERAARRILDRFRGRWIVADLESLDRGARGQITIWEVRRAGKTRDLGLIPSDRILDLAHVREGLRARAGGLLHGARPETVTAVADLVGALLKANLTLDVRETESRRESARKGVKPVLYQMKKGEMIVRVGERVTLDEVRKLEALRQELSRGGRGSALLATALLLALLLTVAVRFTSEGIRKFDPSMRNLAFLAVVLAASTALVRLSVVLLEGIEGRVAAVSPEALRYAMPVAAAAMLVRLVLNSETAMAFSIPSALLTGIVVEWSLPFAVYALLVSMTGAYAVRHAERRGRVLRAGVTTGLVGAGGAAALAALSIGTPGGAVLASGFFGFLGGLGSGFLVTAVTPVVETAFGFVTDVSLLELASMDHPALRELVLKAPGSYHHSIMVGNLAEAAAQSIHANPLLAKVGAYYHDIGKSAHPDYFVENAQGKNPHAPLSPRMSRVVIESHVREGVELGRKWRIPQAILDFIPQHHGTGLIRYFYDKALRQGEGDAEEEFRYPGPRPQSRETAIVMLADQVEAAGRALQDSTPAQIEAMVRRIVDFNFMDGQLDECNLTLRDLHRIGTSFVRTLNVFYHRRVEYPPVVEGKGPLGVVGTPHGGQRQPSPEPPLGSSGGGAPNGGSRPSKAGSR